MEKGVVYDVLPRNSAHQRGAWIQDGKYFVFTDGKLHHDADVIGDRLILRMGGFESAKIDGLVMTRIDGGGVFDLVPRA